MQTENTLVKREVLAKDVRHSENISSKFEVVDIDCNIGDFELETGDDENILILLSEEDFKLLLPNRKIPKEGKYTNSKRGTLYSYKGVVYNPTNNEIFVWYQAEYQSIDFGDKSQWARPFDMFEEEVEIYGMKKPRFEFCGQ